MALSTAEKKEIISKYQLGDQDVGSVEVQVALLTADIEKLTHHFNAFPKDKHSHVGLLKKVNKRRRLLRYLKNKVLERYRSLIDRLSLRDSQD